MVHTPIKGYREVSEDELKLVNQIKEVEERVLRMFEALVGVDTRWRAIAITHIQEGFGAINRSILQPARISLPEDDGTPAAGPAEDIEKESP